MKSSFFNVILTVFLLWLTIQLKSSYEDYLAYFFVLTVGIMHGANDISLIELVTKNSSKSKFYYLIFYIGLIVIMSVAFFQFPIVALLIFVLFSCYHFGEQHFYSLVKAQNLRVNMLYMSYGLLIFGLLFYLNHDKTAYVILELAGIEISKMVFKYLMICGIILLVLSFILNKSNFKTHINVLKELFVIILFALIFELASLLWAFAIYFVVWHSIPSLKDQTYALYGSLNKKTLIQYIKASFINWGVSVIGLFIIYYVSTLLNYSFIALFFAFLAAITIPHVIVMYFLNKK